MPEFRFVGGDERRKTGSCYTHPSLVQVLVGYALEPVMQDRLKAAATNEERTQTPLGMSVCDPAAGSGHFLLATARAQSPRYRDPGTPRSGGARHLGASPRGHIQRQRR